MIRARRDQYAVLLGIGAFTGIIAMLMHSVTDFNMHNGADGLYFFFLCDLLVDDELMAEMLLEKGYKRGLDSDELAVNYTDYLLSKVSVRRLLR